MPRAPTRSRRGAALVPGRTKPRRSLPGTLGGNVDILDEKAVRRKSHSGICVYCCKEVDHRNIDHVFPAAWYPATTPPNLEKWQVPSCVPCNSTHGRNEEDLLRRIGLCLGPNELAAAGIPDKALRSIQPQHAKSDRDKRARAAARAKIKNEVTVLDEPPGEGVFPNFGPQPGVTYPKYLIVPVPKDGLVTFARKIVRGLTHLLESTLIPDDDSIDITFVEDRHGAELRARVRASGTTYHRGPGIVVERAVAADDFSKSLWHITIFGRMKIWAAVNVRTNSNTRAGDT